ncbi:MAG: hypothetical protein WC346_09215 [Methanogenium sp.]
MCEIQFLKKMNGEHLNEEDLIKFISLMKLGDIGNNHAFGLFNSKGSFKSSGKFDYTKLDELMIKSDSFIVGHNRFATKGCSYIYEEIENPMVFPSDSPFYSVNAFPGNFILNLRYLILNKGFYQNVNKTNEKPEKIKVRKKIYPNINNHPFNLNDFTLVHNGHIFNDDSLRIKYKIKSDIKTDSYVILWLINKFFDESKLKERRSKIIESIKRTIKLIDGTYSVFLFDSVSKELFYFKDKCTSFAFCKIGDLLIGSTDKTNFKYAFGLKLKKNKKEILIPRSNTIYLIEYNSNNIIKNIGNILQIEEKKELKGGKKKK